MGGVETAQAVDHVHAVRNKAEQKDIGEYHRRDACPEQKTVYNMHAQRKQGTVYQRVVPEISPFYDTVNHDHRGNEVKVKQNAITNLTFLCDDVPPWPEKADVVGDGIQTHEGCSCRDR